MDMEQKLNQKKQKTLQNQKKQKKLKRKRSGNS